MQSAKEKISNTASAAEEHVNICMANIEEKAEKATARTVEENQMAHELKQRWSCMKPKIEMLEDKQRAKVSHHFPAHVHEPPLVGAHYGHNEPVVGQHGHRPVGTAVPMAGTAVPSYPLGGDPPPPGYKRYLPKLNNPACPVSLEF